MDIHNTSEDIVVKIVDSVIEDIKKRGNPKSLCLCEQCRIDTICFVLNRIEPRYIVSNRGSTRIDHTGFKHQQDEADITSLVLKGLKLVNHNMRDNAKHKEGESFSQNLMLNSRIFDIPSITGRIFDGLLFEPVVGIEISLYCEGELVKMRNSNWQNPYTIVPSTPGTFSFWPVPVVNDDCEEKEKEFKYSLVVRSPEYEVLNHFFSIKSVCNYHTPHSHAMNRSFKLPDLYLFPPGESEMDW